MNSSTSQLDDTLGKRYSDLSPKLQTAARFVLNNPKEIATQSLRHVAKRSGLSPPTFSRLARAIGFAEYEKLRDICRAELGVSKPSLAERAVAMQRNKHEGSSVSRGAFAEAHALAAIENINHLVQNLDLEKLADVADQLARASSVGLIGSLSSRAILEYMAHMATLATSNWKMVEADSGASLASLSFDNDSAMILLVSLSPYSRRTFDMARVAGENGCEIIAITDDISSPVLKYGTHSFLVGSDSPQFFPSYVAVLTLLEILMGMVVRRLGDDANKRIDGVERLSRAIGDYVE